MRILCFGDSNTWGYISGTDHHRYDENKRWTRLLSKKLGPNYEIIEEGLNSRTLNSDYPLEYNRPYKKGLDYFYPCLTSQDKVDVIVIMLGTNDLKNFFNLTASDMLSNLRLYIDYVQNYKSIIDGSTPKLIISGIAPIDENNCKTHYKGRVNIRNEYNVLSKNLCDKLGIPFVDNSDLQVGIDGVHITEQSHVILAEKLYKEIKSYE